MGHRCQYFMIITTGCILNPSTQHFAINNRRILRRLQKNCRFHINQVDIATHLFQQHVFRFVHPLCSVLYYSLQVNFIMTKVFLWIIASCGQISLILSLVCLILIETSVTCFVFFHIFQMSMSLRNKFVGTDYAPFLTMVTNILTTRPPLSTRPVPSWKQRQVPI